LNDRYIFAIDPGTEKSAFVLYDSHDKAIIDKGIDENFDLLDQIMHDPAFQEPVFAIEMIASYGMPVGKEVFETCVWIGRFVQAYNGPHEIRTIYRRTVKTHLCGSMKAKDANIRQALLDKLGKEATKGVSKDIWSALAVAVCVAEGATQ
jgi:Holliday junction resolvasome RuvABC endonuclease subunit